MPKTLLLADDSLTIQRVVELTFAREDVRVISVADGEQAIEAIKRSVPDVVLADIDMPVRSGFDVAQFIRSQAATAAVPVLLLAGAFESVDQAQAHQAGADGILTKPFDPAVLMSRVMELLATGRGTPSVVHIHPPSPTAAFRSTRALEGPPVLEPIGDAPGEVPAGQAHAADGSGALPPEPALAVVPLPDSSEHGTPEPAPEPLPESPTLPALVDVVDVAAPIAEPDAPAVVEPERADYFDQIDLAFAALSKNPRPPAPADEDELPPLDDDEPLMMPPVAALATPRTVPLTDAFAALLDAERSGQPDPALRVAPVPPSTPATAPSAAPAIDLDALADQIASRVLAQLSDRIVRETVADITAATAERLVREEIERIKRNIK